MVWDVLISGGAGIGRSIQGWLHKRLNKTRKGLDDEETNFDFKALLATAITYACVAFALVKGGAIAGVDVSTVEASGVTYFVDWLASKLKDW